mgnify:CR=1 FL=1
MSFKGSVTPCSRSSGRAGYTVSYVLLLSAGIATLLLVAAGPFSPSPPASAETLRIPGEHPSLPAMVDRHIASVDDPDVRAVLDEYCVTCHNQRRPEAGLALDTIDASLPSSRPATWEKVISKLRTGLMPPGGRRRPDAATYEAVSEWLEGQLDSAWVADPDPYPGRVSPFHRLNRTEYQNAIRDLLLLPVDVRSRLPGDETADGGFDNVASSLTISPAHVDRYLSVARYVTRLATGLPPSPSATRYITTDATRHSDRMSEDLPIGSRGGMAVRHYFPADAEYEISLRLQENYANYVKGMGWEQEIDVRVDGVLVERFTVGGGGAQFRPGPHSYEGAGDGPGWPGSRRWEEYMQLTAAAGLRVRVPVTAGEHVVGVSFPRDVWEEESLLPQRPHQARGQTDAFNANRMSYAGIREVYIEGPYETTGVAEDTPSRRAIFVCEPEREADEDACASEILSGMARRAYRRPVAGEELRGLLDFYRMGREDGGSFDHGIQFGLERILADPSFLLRVHREPGAGTAAIGEGRATVRPARGQPSSDEATYALSDLEIASRLAFFLWSSIPDEDLLELAEGGRLTDQSVLRGQVSRMLADPRALDALVHDFASQWLTLRPLDDRTVRDRLFIDYDHNLRDAMGRETELFVGSTIREDQSVLELLRADYTYLNERLARHYGIPNVYGSHFRRVTLPDLNERGGLLGHASLLSVTSYPDRTSPVLRGKWLLENILGMTVPPPPPGVDTELRADDEQGGVGSLPLRELLEQHRTDPSCATCHAILDPMGLALEGYDAVGRRRTIDETGTPVNDVGSWPTGVEVKGLAGVRSLLLGQGEQFARTVTAKLMAYSLGRELEYYDMPAVRTIVRNAEATEYRWSSIIQGIIESPQFLRSARAGAEVLPEPQPDGSNLHEERNGLHYR